VIESDEDSSEDDVEEVEDDVEEDVDDDDVMEEYEEADALDDYGNELSDVDDADASEQDEPEILAAEDEPEAAAEAEQSPVERVHVEDESAPPEGAASEDGVSKADWHRGLSRVEQEKLGWYKKHTHKNVEKTDCWKNVLLLSEKHPLFGRDLQTCELVDDPDTAINHVCMRVGCDAEGSPGAPCGQLFVLKMKAQSKFGGRKSCSTTIGVSFENSNVVKHEKLRHAAVTTKSLAKNLAIATAVAQTVQGSAARSATPTTPTPAGGVKNLLGFKRMT
jgi:hypothetical protein